MALLLALTIPGVHAAGVDLTTAETGTVNGDIAILPGIMWNTSWTTPGGVVVTQDYVLPAFDTVQWARLYVSVYCGSTSGGARETFVNISLDGDGGDGTYTPSRRRISEFNRYGCAPRQTVHHPREQQLCHVV
ncbi:DUF3344 domain-containing protein [Methanogenium cariaci]|uniref:DUF3344 domain-containing protein n=1 Tax=Methanogenium cariaci TaxID=2197 RepID=UPI00155DC89E|nr:DUF3344 domain-containing protein [Methanogenium cariaci]